MVDELPDEREPGEQALACFGEEYVAGVWLDHRACQAVQQVVRRRERRKLLEHEPEPALGQPVLARQVHAPKLGAMQATGSGAACATVGI